MTVKYLEPMAEAGATRKPYELSVGPDGPSAVGLFSNSFPDSAGFLEALVPHLSPAFPRATFRRYDKGGAINASAPAADWLIGSITEECQAVITAWGH